VDGVHKSKKTRAARRWRDAAVVLSRRSGIVSSPSRSTQGADMQIQPYLFFEGRCEEALNFYREHLGAQTVMMMRFKDNPDAGKAEAPSGCSMPEGTGEKIMHCAFTVGDSMVMASDGMCSGKASFAGISLSLSADSPEQAEERFNALANGGQVQMPMGPTFFAKRFGMVQDKFGVSWMVLGGMEHVPA
jgi:PhnB protein